MHVPPDSDRVRQIFHDALECETDERPAFLAGACAGDTMLRREVESLLLPFSRHQELLQSPMFEVSAAEVANQVLGHDEETLISWATHRSSPNCFVSTVFRWTS